MPAAAEAQAKESETRGWDQALGIDLDAFVSQLDAHKDTYLNTPYQTALGRYGGPGVGMDCSSFLAFALAREANVDTKAAFGSYDPNGTGYSVAAPSTTNWVKWARDNNLAIDYYDSFEGMLAAGSLRKGDLVIVSDSPAIVAGSSSHALIHWGGPNENLAFHETTLELAPGNVAGRYCQISNYVGKKGTRFIAAIHGSRDVTIRFTKTSADAELTDGNGQYNLAGAEYRICRASDEHEVARVTLDEQGHASLELERGRYFAQETRAPQGFKLSDEKVYFEATDDRGEVSLRDRAGTARVRIQKADTTGSPQPGTSLAGAVLVLTDSLGRTHEARTDADGRAEWSGLPLGDCQIVETKAPEGYRINPTVHHVSANAQDLPGSGELVIDAGAAVQENVIAFDVEITKFLDKNEEGSGLREPASGVSFELVSNTTGQALGTITTNADGIASTRDPKSVNPEAISDERTHDASKPWFGNGRRTAEVNGALPFDPKGYSIREVAETVPAGFQKADDWTVSAEEMADGSTKHYILDNATLSSRLQIVKQDAESGQTVPLAGFTFQLLDEQGNPLTQENWYPNHVELNEFVTDASGMVTLPQALRPGTYRIHETTAEPPYVVGEDVTFTIPSDGSDLPKVTVVGFSDRQAKGRVRLTKVCSEDKKPLAGAEFDVVAQQDVTSPDGVTHVARGQVVGHVTTDKNGAATVEGLYLGDGSATYAFVETVSPAGHALDTAPHEFTVTYKDQTSETVEVEVAVENAPTRVSISKGVKGREQALEGATFTAWRDGENIEIPTREGKGSLAIRISEDGDRAGAPLTLRLAESDEAEVTPAFDMANDVFSAQDLEPGIYEVTRGDKLLGTLPVNAKLSYAIVKDDKVELADTLLKPNTQPIEATTDKEGNATLRHLTKGTWHVQELKAPKGYLVDPSIKDVVVDEQGLIDGTSELHLDIKDDFTKVEITKRDITSEKEVVGAHLSVIDKAGKTLDSWVSEAKPHRIENLTPGTYTLREELAPKTYEKANEVTFTVRQTGKVQKVSMYDKPIVIAGQVDKRQEIAAPIAENSVADSRANGSDPARLGGSFDYTVDFRSTSTTWVDEFVADDQISAAKEGLAHVTGITTPVIEGDFDGALNVWYQTNHTDPAYLDGKANATRDDDHKNPWLDDPKTSDQDSDRDGRVTSYEGWRLWRKNLPAEEACDLTVSDLKLEEGEHVTSVRLEYGRVESGFTSRKDGWGRDDLKDVHDNLGGSESKREGLSPLVVHMKATKDYVTGETLANEATIASYRNGGGPELEAHDQDKVEQKATSKVIAKLAQTGANPLLRGIILLLLGTAGGLQVFRGTRKPRVPRGSKGDVGLSPDKQGDPR